MPTENRSSNTEMVSFPRELSDDLAELIAARARVCGGGAFEIWEEICNGFGKPADQHQGEPVAYADPRSFENLKSFGRLGGIYLHEWMWAEPEPGMVPLYTHADPGEVERLHKIAYDTQAALIAANRQIKMLEGELDTLRAQLAEQDALLKRQPSFIRALEQFEADDGTFVRLTDVLGVLSASVEPSEECAHSYANKLGCPECGEAFSGSESSGLVERGPWQPLTAPGQIQEGDWLSFTVSGSLICAQTRLVIDPGTAREEIVYNRQKNHYFVTLVAVDGTSTHKGVLVAKAKS